MPELPEVETVLRSLKKSEIIGSPISQIEIKKSSHIKGIDVNEFVNNLTGKTIHKIERKGKWLFFFLDNLVLLSHLRMTGKYFFEENFHEISLKFTFANGKKLIYCDPRGFGVFYLQPIETFYFSLPYKEIGPDLIQEEITTEYLISCFKSKRIPIKAALLQQKDVSGIGNIYDAEILGASKINPFKPANKISYKEAERIIKFSKIILQKAIDMGGTSVVDFVSPLGKGSYQNELKFYMRENKPCYECRTLIIMKKINNRSSFFCPRCQELVLE